jgi:hypothetical protein
MKKNPVISSLLLVFFSIFTINGVFGQVVTLINHPPTDGSVGQCLILDQKIWMGTAMYSTIYHYSGSSWSEGYVVSFGKISGAKGSSGEDVIYQIGPDSRINKWDSSTNTWLSIPNPPNNLVGGYAPDVKVVDETHIYLLANYCYAEYPRLYRYTGSEFIELFVDSCSTYYEDFLYADTEKVIFSRKQNNNVGSGVLSCYYLEHDIVVDLVTIPNITGITNIKSVNGEDFFILARYGKVYHYNINTQILRSVIVLPQDEQYAAIEVAGDNRTLFIGGTGGITKVLIPDEGEAISQVIYSISDDNLFIQSSSSHNDKMIFGGILGSPSLIVIDCTTGVIETTLPDIHIFPNPSTDWIKIDGLKETFHVQIFDIAGKLVLSQECQIEETINISGLNAGMYIVHVQNSEGVFSTKLVKE